MQECQRILRPGINTVFNTVFHYLHRTASNVSTLEDAVVVLIGHVRVIFLGVYAAN